MQFRGLRGCKGLWGDFEVDARDVWRIATAQLCVYIFHEIIGKLSGGPHAAIAAVWL